MTPAERRTIDNVNDITHDTTVLATTISPALNQLDQSLAGYPATVIGAAPPEPTPSTECHHPDCTNTLPCEQHEPAVNLTPTERQAGHPDKARTDYDKLTRLIRRIHCDINTAATISQRWGTAAIDGQTVRQRLTDALSTIWCVNCRNNGIDQKRTHGDYCEFCSGIKSKYKRYPNRQLCEMNSRGLRVMPSDVARAFKTKPANVEPAPVDSLTEARTRRQRRIQDAS